MHIRVLQWLDTYVVHHRYEWHGFNVARPLLKRLICDRFERRICESIEDPAERAMWLERLESER